MKNSLMTMRGKILLRKRSVIETANNELKNICPLEHFRHRSFANFIANIVARLITYCFLPKKPSISINRSHLINNCILINRTQVANVTEVKQPLTGAAYTQIKLIKQQNLYLTTSHLFL
jgi:hypothetical protein